MTRHRSAFLLAATALLATAPAAQADDAGVFNVYVARQASELDPAGRAYVRAFKRAARKPTTARLRAVIRANRRINAVLDVIEAELVPQVASTNDGARARRQALREIRTWHRANRIENAAWRALIKFKFKRFERGMRRFDRTLRRAGRYGRHAVRRFRQAGFSSPEGPLTTMR